MTTVVMPQLGESVMEGTVVRWIARPGQKVERDEPLVEIATDKANTEIPSPSSEEHTSELQSPCNLVCRLLLEKKKKRMESIALVQLALTSIAQRQLMLRITRSAPVTEQLL